MYEGIKWARTCQFGALWPPMYATIMLEPLDVNENAQHKIYIQLESKINRYLQKLSTDGKDVIYIQFLKELDITHEQYILALCSILKKPKLFLKRNVKDICINAYMKDLAVAWQANHYVTHGKFRYFRRIGGIGKLGQYDLL